MSRSVYYLVIGLLIIISVLLILGIISSIRKRRLYSQNGLYENHKDLRSLFEKIYNALDDCKFTRYFIRSCSNKFRLYYSSNSKEVYFLTIKLIIKSIIVSLFIIFICVSVSFTLFSCLSALFLCFVFCVEMKCADVAKLEIRFLKEFDSFISVVRHHFYRSGSIRDALFFTINDVGELMKGHAISLYEIICKDSISESTNEYLDKDYHKYLKLFLSLAEMVEENGDIVDREGSVFLNSCMQLRNDVQEEKRYIEARRHKFAALSYTAGLPIISIPFIAEWGTGTIPSLIGFYQGYVGFVVKTILFAISYICFCAIVRLREGDNLSRKNYVISYKISETKVVSAFLNRIIHRFYSKSLKMTFMLKRLGEKYSIKTLYVHKFLNSLVLLVLMFILVVYGHWESRQIILKDVGDVSNLSTSADGRQIEAMERNIIGYVNEILNDSREASQQIQYNYAFMSKNEFEKWLVERLIEERDIRTIEVAEASAREIIRRVSSYETEHFTIRDLFLVVTVAMIGFVYPTLTIILRNHLSENRMQEEILQFQSIIHMLKKVPGISVMSLLEEIESFSVIFKPSIQQCINEFGISELQAFERLYDAEKYIGLRRIVDGFLMVDEMGIEDAFEEISADITNFRDNKKLERQILLDNEGLLGSLLAVIPGGVILFGYLLCPFLIRSVQIFNSYQEELSRLIGG